MIIWCVFISTWDGQPHYLSPNVKILKFSNVYPMLCISRFVSNGFKVGGYAYATLDFQICFGWFGYTFILQIKAKR